jgi:hypothetical protein
LDHRDYAIREAENNASLVLQSLVALQEQTARGTKQMLSTLAHMQEVKSLDTEACNKLFREVRDQNPSYAAIYAIRPDGTYFAASSPFQP